MQIKLKCIWCLFFVLQSCGLLTDERGTGKINVTMNGQHYELTNVSGTEYMGFYCGGDLLNKRLGLGLGQNPQTGDTLLLDNQRNSFYPNYCIYHHSYAIANSGKIIITKRSGEDIQGRFYFDAIVDGDTLQFRDGSFNVNCPPSR